MPEPPARTIPFIVCRFLFIVVFLGVRVAWVTEKLGVFGLRPGLGTAYGRFMGWPTARNLREYFRIVFVVSALFSQYNRFLDCEKMRKGRNGRKLARCACGVEGWPAARNSGKSF